jgi:hypothetical protein
VTKEESKNYLEGWRLVNEFTEQERSQLTLENKLADFAMLFDFAKILRASNPQAEIERVREEAAVRAIWQRLKEPLHA